MIGLGDRVLLAAIGAGLTYGATVLVDRPGVLLAAMADPGGTPHGDR